MRVLLVDDSIAICRVEKVLLASMNFFSEIVEANDGLEALKIMASRSFDLVLIDWNMPGLSGVDTLRQIKANPATASALVLLVTSESRKEKIVEAIKAGADDYITKPFDEDVLREKLGPLLERKAISSP